MNYIQEEKKIHTRKNLPIKARTVAEGISFNDIRNLFTLKQECADIDIPEEQIVTQIYEMLQHKQLILLKI